MTSCTEKITSALTSNNRVRYLESKSGQLDLLLMEDSFATRPSRFLSSVWREFTSVR